MVVYNSFIGGRHAGFADDQVSVISREEFGDLVVYSKQWLIDNFEQVTCEKNESGFDRVNIPVPEYLNAKIAKIRLNYWPGHRDADAFMKESIHNHPRYFESFIIKGSYTHSLYDYVTPLCSSPDVNRYTAVQINKQATRSLLPENQLVYLRKTETISVQPGDIVMMPTSTIHQVISAQNGTLSLNVVFKNFDELSSYKVFLSEEGSIDDVVTERTTRSTEYTADVVREIIAILSGFGA